MHITLITLIGFSRSKRRDISAWRKSDIHDNKWEPIACKLQLFKKHEFGFTILNAFDNFRQFCFHLRFKPFDNFTKVKVFWNSLFVFYWWKVKMVFTKYIFCMAGYQICFVNIISQDFELKRFTMFEEMTYHNNYVNCGLKVENWKNHLKSAGISKWQETDEKHLWHVTWQHESDNLTIQWRTVRDSARA